jgi:hypothetical protein
MKKVEMPVVRILSAIRRIGYTPVSAVLDIIDNSIVAGAAKIEVVIATEQHPAKQLKEQITEIIVIDNGSGMTEERMLNALTLGSPDSDYDDGSLSKFGFGLKSAGLSQANTITLISKALESSAYTKMVLNWDTIVSNGYYGIIDDSTIDDKENDLLSHIGDSSGTIVRLHNIIQVNDIAPVTIVKSLRKECALTYHRFIEGGRIDIVVNGEQIIPIDPLFLSEADSLIADYDGTKPCRYYINPIELPLNTSSGTTMVVNAIQLPYPPLFKETGQQREVQSKYDMYLKNIGFYIYRNNRLICKADKLGLVPFDQDYMSFRASIDLDTFSDDDVNLDVSKTKVIFPDYAFDSLKDSMNGVIRKSKELWKLMAVKRDDPHISESERTHERSNKLLGASDPLIVDTQEGEIRPTAPIVAENKEVIEEQYARAKSLLELLKGKRKRIIPVDELPESQLWQPNIDENNNCDVVVYLSRRHPFYEHIYQKLETGDDTAVILDALFLNLSMAEVGIIASNRELNRAFELLRATTSYQLSRFIEANLEDEE